MISNYIFGTATGEVRRKIICYYITGHGLGHATRSVELVRSLLLTDYFDIHVVTTVSSDFFHNALESSLRTVPNAKFTHHNRLLDSGAIQLDALRVDPVESLRLYFLNIHTKREYLLQAEVQWLQSNLVDLVIVDATPLGCAAGRLASIPTVLLTNFTWDFCYWEMLQKPYVQDSLIISKNKKAKITEDQLLPVVHSSDKIKMDTKEEKEEAAVCTKTATVTATATDTTTATLADYEEMVSQCTADSFSCDWYIKLPGQTPILSSAQVRSIEGPLMARLASRSARKTIREELGISEEKKILLLGFGGHDTRWNLRDSFMPTKDGNGNGWVCLILGIKSEQLEALSLPQARFIPIGFESYVPDLIAAADVVMGKIGYGFVSECIANGTPLIYVPRSDWPEEEYVESLLLKYNAGLRLAVEDFHQGAWAAALSAALKLKSQGWTVEQEKSPVTAAETIVKALIDIVNNK